MRLDELCGNPAVHRRLETARGLSHAYILAGPPGCGKRTLAAALTAALLCSGGGEIPCGQCSDCRKAAHGAHPDLKRVGEDGKDINVAQIRALRSDAYIRPNEAGRKVYVVENAQTMNPSAQNALLKLLEDGPAYVAFLLLTDNAGALLQTVRSRCETLTLSPVTTREAEAFLLARFPGLDRARVVDAALRCEGMLGRAIAWLEGTDETAAALRSEAEGLKLLLLGKSELALLERCVALESKDRTALGALLAETVQVLHEDRGVDSRRRLGLIALLKRLGADLEFNVGPGHIAGALCAAAHAL